MAELNVRFARRRGEDETSLNARDPFSRLCLSTEREKGSKAVLPPVAIVWPCTLSVDAYASLGKNVEVPRPDCPSCSAAMTFWSGYVRPVRVLGRCVRLFVRRARCRSCGVTHALLPGFALVKRLDVVETIGEAIEAVTGGQSGVRPVARTLGISHTTVRGWLRRFAGRSAELAMSFAALALDLGAVVTDLPQLDPANAVGALRRAFVAASALPGWMGLGAWRFCSVVCGGRLLATNTISPYLVIGRRRFMAPVPLPHDEESQEDGT